MSWQQNQGYAAGTGQAVPPAYEGAGDGVVKNRKGRPALRRWLLIGLVVVGFAVAAAVIALYYGATLGVVTALLAIVFAAIPLGVVVPTFLWLDRFEAEPTRYLIVAFLWGALVAALLAGVINTGAAVVFASATGNTDSAMLATAVISAPVVEEAGKGLLVLLIWWLRRREFDGIIDGIVYAGVVAAGFAFTENIQYLGKAYEAGGGEALAGLFILRCLFTPFAHPMFTVMTGIGIGIAATSRSGLLKFFAPVAGYVLAVLAHGLWNLAAVTSGEGLLAVYFLVEVPVFIAFLLFVLWARRREGRLIGRHLMPYADAGWLAPAEVQMLGDMKNRRSARKWAKSTGGGAALTSMRAFQDAASELALLRQRMYHSAADSHALQTERELLELISARRREFLGAR